jgi:hypothetical protein
MRADPNVRCQFPSKHAQGKVALQLTLVNETLPLAC